MQERYPISRLEDRGGRRLGIDRRQVFIPGYQPERRSCKDRRSIQDRITRNDLEDISYLRRNMDRYREFINTNKGMAYAPFLSFPLWALIISIVIFKFWF